MAIRAVIFDLYGVLGLNGWQAFKTEHFAHREMDWERLRALGRRVDEGLSSEAELVAAVAAATGVTPETVRYQFEHTVPNRALLDFIRSELRGQYRLGLLSNASRDVMGDIFLPEERAMFDAVVSSYLVGLAKPDPAMFDLMSEQLGVAPGECIMIDDQQRHLDAAHGLGMHTILYTDVPQVIREMTEVLSA